MFVLALPILAEQVLNFLVGFYDTWLSGRLTTEAIESTTAIGLAAYVGWLASMLFGLVATGTTAIVARHRGAGQVEEANRVMNRSLALAAVAGGGVYAIIYVGAPVMATLLGFEPRTEAIVVRYLRIDGIGHLATGLTLAGAAALRGAGDMRSPMLVLGAVSILNVIISTALVFGVGPLPAVGIETVLVAPMGIDGIVLGTLVARFGGAALLLVVLGRGVSGLKLSAGELRLGGDAGRRVLAVGGPAAVDGAVSWCGQFLFLMIIARLGTAGRQSVPFAAHIIGVRVEGITYLPAVAWAMAAATMVGQSLGADRRQRAIAAGHAAAVQCGVLAAVIGVVFLVAARPIFSMMHGEPSVADVGTLPFQVNALFQVPLALSIIYVGALRGAGDTRYPMLINAIGIFGVRLPLAWFLAVTCGTGLLGAWIAMAADVTVRTALLLVRYRRGRWLETRV